jgi:signal transduction histidine kinase
MKKARVLLVMALAIVAGFTAVAMAQEHGTKDEAVALVNAALAHVKDVGPQQAFKDFTTDRAKWTKKDLYVIAFDMKGTMLAHGTNEKLVGINQIEIKDADGKPMTAEMTKLAQTKGDGWVDYQWVHPQTKKIAAKSTYVHKVPNFDGWLGVGVYR